LAQRRPLFHSERDFQHAFAWSVQLLYPLAEIRLEPRPRRGVHLDLLVRLGRRSIAVEVKYLVAAFTGRVDGELFDLPNQGAHDISRHDVVKDIVRLERLVGDGYADAGVGLTLTNDSMYWRPGTKASSIDAAFRLHEGRTLSGVLSWSATAGAGTTRGRDIPLALAGTYPCSWQPYTTVKADNGQVVELRYLLIQVYRHGAPPTTAPVPVAPAPPTPGPMPQQYVPRSLTARDEILLAVADILRRSGRDSFELSDVMAEMRRRGTSYAESTIRTHVTSRMCADSPDHRASTFDDFQRLDRGRYRLRP
jgi:hypothetical protein